MSILTQEFVFAALEAEKSGTAFPIDFDDAWQALGYSRKQRGKDAVIANLIENQDYFSDLPLRVNRLKSMVSGSPEYAAMSRREFIFLSCDGYDHFAMMAQTPEGRQARKEFIGYKKAYRASLERSLNAPADPMIDPTKFDYNFDAAIQVTGHRQYISTQKRLLGYLTPEKDYRWEGATLWLSNPIYYSFIAASRTTDGIDLETLGGRVVLLWSYYCRVNKALKSPLPKNTLLPRSRQAAKSDQLRLF